MSLHEHRLSPAMAMVVVRRCLAFMIVWGVLFVHFNEFSLSTTRVCSSFIYYRAEVCLTQEITLSFSKLTDATFLGIKVVA